MIPIICSSDETKLGFLKDCIKASVTEERNGIYELSLEYPVTGKYYTSFAVDNLIKAKPNLTSDNQFFKIYAISKPINGIVTVKAEHISYSTAHYPIKAVSLSSSTGHVAINAVLSEASNYLQEPHKFSVGTCDIETLSDFKVQTCSARAALGGIDGSVLDVYGGEFEFDNYTVNLWKNRGSDKGLSIAYGKNMTDLKFDITLENSYTGVFPYCKDKDENIIMLDEGTYNVTNSSGISERILLLDCTSMFEDNEARTQANLRKYAEKFCQNNDINAIDGTMKVSMIDLSKSQNHKDFAVLKTASLCDTVEVVHKILNVTVKMKVIKTVFDVIDEKYNSLELGSVRSNFADTIKQLTNTAEQAKDNVAKAESRLVKEYKAAIENATKAITGASGGYVVLNPPENPSEILILCDSDKISEAQKVWRFNSAGLAYSSTGYEGPYGPALLAEGKFVINDITAMTISANLIRSGMLTSADGNTYFNLDGNEFVTQNENRKTKIKAGSITTEYFDEASYNEQVVKLANLYGEEMSFATKTVTSLKGSEMNRSTGLSYSVSDSAGTIVPVMWNYITGNDFHSTITTCLSRYDKDTSGGTYGQQFAGFKHYRYVGDTQYNTALGIGSFSGEPTTALEMKNSEGKIVSRVDFYEHGEPGAIKICGTTYDGSKYYYSTELDLTPDYLNVVSGAYYASGYKVASASSSAVSLGNSGQDLYLYANGKIVCMKKVYMPYSYELGTASFTTKTVEAGEEVIPENVLEYFDKSEITIQPSLKITTQSYSEFVIDVETGEETEIVVPETTSTERPDVYFTSMESVPDILKDEEETGVNLFAMVHLEWKAIQELYCKLKSAQQELETLKTQIGG